jgi:mono/diheme cytochrome c family protein
MTRSTLVVALLLASSISVAFAQGTKPRPQDTDWVAPAEVKARTSPVEKSREGLERGRKLYLKHCSDCHGPKGKGDGPLSRLHAQRTLRPPYDLTDPEVQSFLSDGEIFWKVTVGYRKGDKVIMPAYGVPIPADEDRWRVVQFVRMLGRTH